MKWILTIIAGAAWLVLASAGAAEQWRTFTNQKGASFEGRVLNVDTVMREATVVVKKTGKNSVLDFDILSEGDVEYLSNWSPRRFNFETDDTSDESDIEGEVSPRIYPHTKDEIRAKISEIKKRTASAGISRDQQDTINQLNIYRFLSGVKPNAEADEQKVKEAMQAAAACKAKGGLSHSLGAFTDKCNLHQGQGAMQSALVGFISDPGGNNRAKRGHRRWCLNPAMVKTGFAIDEGYVAMWAVDHSGSASKRNWSYPGAGFFPKEYLHGNGWSFYSTENVPSKDELKVEVYKLKNRPEKKFGHTAEIPGRPIEVAYVFSYANTINFEPAQEKLGRGVFWVKINGGGLREGYLVELY